MTAFSVVAQQRTDDYAVVSTLTGTPIEPGQSITLSGLGNGLNGTYTVLLCPQYAFTGVDGSTGALVFDHLVPRENQVLFYDAGDDVEWQVITALGTLTWAPTCTWVTAQQVEDYLGIPTPGAEDLTFLAQCAAAANAFAYRRRAEAGYLQESLSTSPSADVTLAVIMIGAAYYRQRSSYSTLASFEQLGAPPANGLTAMTLQLLGVNRPQVA